MAGWRTAPDTGASRPQVRASRLDQGFPARRIPEVADSSRAARCHTPGMVPRSLMLRLTRETEHDVSRTVVDERYWLAHSDGFRVDGPAGRLGTVLRVIDGDQTLVIRTGMLGNRTLLARYDQVERLEPWREWLSLAEVPTPAGAAA